MKPFWAVYTYAFPNNLAMCMPLLCSKVPVLTAFMCLFSLRSNLPVFCCRALACGCRQPVLAVVGAPDWPEAGLLCMLGALDAAFVPLEIREDLPDKASKLQKLAVFGISPVVVKRALALDQAK